MITTLRRAAALVLCAFWPVCTAQANMDNKPDGRLLSPPGDGASCAPESASGQMRIDELVARALCHDPRTARAWAEILAATAQSGIARAAYYPQLDASLEYVRTRQDYRERLGLLLDNRSRGYGLRAAWLLFDFGRRQARLSETREDLQAKRHRFDAVSLDVSLDTIEAYFDALDAHAALSGLEQMTRLLSRVLESVRIRQREGIVAVDEVRTIEAEVFEMNIRLTQARAVKNKTQGRLAVLTGLEQDTGWSLPGLNALNTADPSPQDFQYWHDRSESHPHVLEADAELRVATHQLKQARAKHAPTLALNAQHTETPPPDSLTLSPDSISTVALQVSIPLFRGFDGRYAVDAARAGMQAKQADVRAAKQARLRRVSESHQDWIASLDVESLMLQKLQKSREAVLGTRKKFDTGLANLSELLRTENELLESSLAHTQAMVARHKARVRLAAESATLGEWLSGPTENPDQ